MQSSSKAGDENEKYLCAHQNEEYCETFLLIHYQHQLTNTTSHSNSSTTDASPHQRPRMGPKIATLRHVQPILQLCADVGENFLGR